MSMADMPYGSPNPVVYIVSGLPVSDSCYIGYAGAEPDGND